MFSVEISKSSYFSLSESYADFLVGFCGVPGRIKVQLMRTQDLRSVLWDIACHAPSANLYHQPPSAKPILCKSPLTALRSLGR